MDNYPPGAANDPNAPYNQPEPVECPDCGGEGTISCSDDDEWDEFNCTTCGGTGFIEKEDE
jgi:DnaJ-class molecular chaperone